MLEYPKIETLYARDETFRVQPDALRWPEFGLVRRWLVTEKVDGTNIRIGWAGGRVTFGGRTDRATIPAPLLAHLEVAFPVERLAATFATDAEVVLFGEGYGEKIQSNPYGRAGVNFRLFDVWVDGWWLERDAFLDVAVKLHTASVPYLGVLGELPTSVEMLAAWAGWSLVADEDRADSLGVFDDAPAANNPSTCRAEGIVARTSPLLFTRNGKRLMWKLKFRDFKTGGR